MCSQHLNYNHLKKNCCEQIVGKISKQKKCRQNYYFVDKIICKSALFCKGAYNVFKTGKEEGCLSTYKQILDSGKKHK